MNIEIHRRAGDTQTDAEYVLYVNNAETRFTAQDARSYSRCLVLNEYEYENGELVAVIDRGRVRTIKAAKEWLLKQAEKCK